MNFDAITDKGVDQVNDLLVTHRRTIYIIGFSLPFAYLLTFVFEGPVLYSLLDSYNLSFPSYIFTAMFAVFVGLLSCGWFVHSPDAARKIMIGGMGVCLVATVPFFFEPSFLWLGGLILVAYAGGCYLAAWGYFLKAWFRKTERLQACADVLIGSNIVLIGIHVATMYISVYAGLILSMFCLAIGLLFLGTLPFLAGKFSLETAEAKAPANVRHALLILCAFVFVITINSGLMYQVMNPAFQHLAALSSWYWAVPYIVAIAIMRNLLKQANRPRSLYIGMIMIMAAFIAYMLLGRSTIDYVVVNTLMLGACGIFDLFWWSILGEMLDYAHNPAKVFGVGLAANVFGVLIGGILGHGMSYMQISSAEITVIALSVLCIAMLFLPPLNRQLLLLLKTHAYLASYDRMNEPQKAAVLLKQTPLEALTVREQEVLQHILTGKPNREIAIALSIAESTVKTHTGNIFAKYDVTSRAELICMLLKKPGA